MEGTAWNGSGLAMVEVCKNHQGQSTFVYGANWKAVASRISRAHPRVSENRMYRLAHSCTCFTWCKNRSQVVATDDMTAGASGKHGVNDGSETPMRTGPRVPR